MEVPRKSALVVTTIYPSPAHPERGTFVESLVGALEAEGLEVHVLAPNSIPRRIVEFFSSRGKTSPASTNRVREIWRPTYWTVAPSLFPNRHWAARVTMGFFRRAVYSCLTKKNKAYDFVLGYFFGSAWAAIGYCHRTGIPCFVELGESDLTWYDPTLGEGTFAATLKELTGIIAVSKPNEAFSRKQCPGLGRRLIFLNNAIDTAVFHARDKLACRKELGLPLQDPIVAFCGHFIERKGPLRVLGALTLVPNLKGIFLGTGSQMPSGDNVLHAGPVPNEQIPKWLCAADVFVLPSLAEGMSVSILEAAACGLPLVVSDREFNRSFLSEDVAVFIDPMDEKNIAEGISRVIGNPILHSNMSRASLALAQQFSLKERTRKLLTFIGESSVH